jgi:iron complex outermembrane receptor protein
MCRRPLLGKIFPARAGCCRLAAGSIAAVAFATQLIGSAAFADQQLEEIVVTAQKRSENIQNVPIAITAFTADTLRSKGLSDIHSLSNLTPNVNLDGGAPFSGDTSVLSASIRGIGQDDFAFNLDPGVGVYLDGVYLARTIGANQSLLDVDRIEILKGPQGTLFGRNTIGGAINIVTHTPGEESTINGSMTIGAYNRHDVNLTADMPISSDILTTVSISSQTRDGYQRTVPYPPSSGIGLVPYQVDAQTDFPKATGNQSSSDGGGQNVQAIRGKLLWHLATDLDLTLSGDYTHEDQPGLANTVLSVTTANASTYINPASLFTGGSFAGVPGAQLPVVFAAGPGTSNLGGTNLMGNFYNLCIVTPASALTSGQFNTTNGLCGPLGVGTWNSATGAFRGNGIGYPGSPALGGVGAVGVPNSVLQGLLAAYPGVAPYVKMGANGIGSVIYPGQTPRIYWDFANTQTGNIDSTYADGPSFAKSNSYGGSATFDWQLTPDMKFKSITGARAISWDIGTDLDGTPESFQEVTDSQGQHQFSQEFQLTGKAIDDRLNYAGGLYYFTEAGYVHDYVPFDTGYLYVYDYQNDVKTDSYAGYAHLDFKLTDNWGVTAGGRYSDEQKHFIGGQGDLDGFSYKLLGCLDPSASVTQFPQYMAFAIATHGATTGTCQQALGFPDPSNPLRYFPTTPDKQSWNVFTPTLGTQYHITPDVMAYASYSKGFKSGGWTTRLSDPISSPSAARFSPEYDKTYELGLKSQWFERHLQADLAVFESKYDSIQLDVQEGPSPVEQNAGDATIKGAELELESVFDNGLSLNFTAGYLDAYYTYLNPCLLYFASATTGVCSAASGAQYVPGFGGFHYGSELPKTPKTKFSLSPTYDFHVANDGTVRIAADYTYVAHMFNDAPNTVLLERGATHTVNASLHYIPPSKRFEFILGGTNLTDDRYLTVGSVNYTAGEVVGTYDPPRMWYFTINAKMP